MQTLKDDIRKKIDEQSIRLFLKQGYRDTTVRQISEAAGVAIGNLYRYYSSKDAIFCSLAKSAADMVYAMLERHHGAKGYDVAEMRREGYVDEVVDEYLYLTVDHRQGLRLLLFCAEGSSMENFREEFADTATRKCTAWFETMAARHPAVRKEVPEFLIYLNNKWMINMLEAVVRHDLDLWQTRAVLSQYVQFQVLGWREMMHV